MLYITIEDITACAFIELSDIRKLSRKAIVLYGNEITNIIEDDTAILLLSRDRTNYFEYRYNHIFDFTDDSIALKDGITSNIILNEFIGSISFPVLKASMDKRAVDVLKGAIDDCSI